MNEAINIFSRAVQTGKTTALMQWANDHARIGGILTPDMHGKRTLYDIQSGEYTGFESTGNHEGTIIVGRFSFYTHAFIKAKSILMRVLQQPVDWLIIDEVGKLEVERDEGLEPAVTNIITAYQEGKGPGRLLLVIRDTLLEKAITKYRLQGATLFNTLPG